MLLRRISREMMTLEFKPVTVRDNNYISDQWTQQFSFKPQFKLGLTGENQPDVSSQHHSYDRDN